MVFDLKRDDALTELDWNVIGRKARRIELPLIPSREGIHATARLLGQLASEMHAEAAGGRRLRSVLSAVSGLVQALNKDLADLAAEHAEREAERAAEADVVRLRAQGGGRA